MATSRTSLVNSPKSSSSGQELMAASTTTTAMPVTTTTDGIGAIIVASNSSNHHHNQLEVNLNSIDDDAIISVTTNNSAILNNANSIVVSDANSIVTSADFITSDILPVIGHYGTYHDISQMQAPQHPHQQSQTHHHTAIYHPMQQNSQNISSNTTVLVDSSSSTSASAIVTTATPATITRRIITPNNGINSATDKRMIINIDTTSTTPTLITESVALGRRVSAGTVTHMLVDECCPTTTTTSPILTQQHHPTILLHTSSLIRTTATSSTQQQLVLPSIITSSTTSSSTPLSLASATSNGITSNPLDQQMPSTSYNVSPSSSQASTSIGPSTIVHHHITTIPSNVSDSGRKIKSSRYQQQTTTGQQHHQQHVAVVNTTATNTISENDLLSAAAHSLSDNLPSGNLINDHMSVVSTNVASDITQSNCNDSGNVILQQQDTPNTTSTTTASVSGANTVSSSPGNNSASNLNLHINSDSCDSANMEIKDISLDDNDGYQDNTSSNSQQSAGGGSVSGGGGAGGSGNGNGISGNGSSASGSYLSLIPPPVGTSGPAQCGEQTDFKYLFEELCPVCGDKVSGYHYGLLTCESCKGFFKRTVQNKKVYTCVAERSCHIDKTQRKRCPYCRFQKCLEVGMKLEAVRADRMRGGRNKFGPMYKRDRARKLQMMRQRQLALQAIRGSMSSTDVKIGQLSPTGYQQSYPSMSIKQEIQIPQVSSLTQSPDSSPSPIAIALGQIPQSTAVNANSLGGSSGTGSTNTTTVSGTGGGGGSGGGGAGGGCGPGGDAGPASLQHSSDSKLCFDTGTNPTSTADSVSTVEPLRVSPMIREFVQSIDDREWQTQLFTLLQKQSYNQVEVDLFELMCKVLDQNLFSQVDWARNTIFFKDLKVDDQMKLLQNSWSDMLVLDHLHQRIHNGLPDETPLHNGQIFHLLGLGLFGLPQLADYFNELQNKLQELKFDMGDYVCMKFLLLLNPDVRGIINKKTVLEGYENVQAALLDYTLTCYPSVTDKFSRLLNILPEIHAVAARGESHLYQRHCAGNAPTQTLLMEMLHAKRKI